MKKLLLLLALAPLLGYGAEPSVQAAEKKEHGGKAAEHGGKAAEKKEHGGAEAKSKDDKAPR